MKKPGTWVTIGQRGFDEEGIKRLVEEYQPEGIRINMGRSSVEWAKNTLHTLEALSYPAENIYIDIANKKPRIVISDDVILSENYLLNIDYDGSYRAEVSVNAEELNQVTAGDKIFFGDGEVEAEVLSNIDGLISARSKGNGVLTKNMAIGVKDKAYGCFRLHDDEVNTTQELLTICPANLILSFVHTPENVIAAMKLFPNAHAIVPKIETNEAVKRIEEILGVSSCIFIGRGDLGLSVGLEKIGLLQKELIAKAKAMNKKVSIGTGTLESLRISPVPLRAEIVDITNSFMEQVDYVALTSETAGSKTPFLAIDWLNRVLDYLEKASERGKLQCQ